MFKLTPEESERALEFIIEQDKKVIEKQKIDMADLPSLTEHGAYYGAIGGGYSYNFTPTSIGTVVSITNNVTKEKLTLTTFKGW